MKGVFIIFPVLLLCGSISSAQPMQPPPMADVKVRLDAVGTLPKVLKEASGIEITSSGLLWTHNDDRFPILYGIDTAGRVIKTIHLNHPNNGWEDLTRDDEGNLFIGAFGNNRNDRKNLAVLKLPDPESINAPVINAEVIAFSYPDQHQFPPPDREKNFDADAFISVHDSLYIFTKNRTRPFTGYTKVYRLPTTAGTYHATLYDSIYLGAGEMMDHWITSADVSPDGKTLALLSHDRMWLISGFQGKRFSQGNILKVELPSFSHKSGLCFASDTKIYLLDELEFGFLGGKIYTIDITPLLRH